MVICLGFAYDPADPLPLTVSCFSKIQIGFTFLVPAHPGGSGQGLEGREMVVVVVVVVVVKVVFAHNCVYVVVSVGSSSLRGRVGKDAGASSTRHAEYSRSMSSDNWREAKKRDAETDVSVSWRSRTDHSRTGMTATL